MPADLEQREPADTLPSMATVPIQAHFRPVPVDYLSGRMEEMSDLRDRQAEFRHVAELLIIIAQQWGLEPTEYINTENNAGETPLSLAANAPEIIRSFADAGAIIDDATNFQL